MKRITTLIALFTIGMITRARDNDTTLVLQKADSLVVKTEIQAKGSPVPQETDEYYNFSNVDNVLTWKKVFTSDYTAEELKTKMEQSNRFKDINLQDNVITASLNPSQMDYRGAGYDYMSTPMYISQHLVGSDVTVQVKENRFRVIMNAIYYQMNSDINMGYVSIPKGSIDSLNSFTKNGSIKKIFFNNHSAEILDYNFTKIFSFPKNNIINDEEDW